MRLGLLLAAFILTSTNAFAACVAPPTGASTDLAIQFKTADGASRIGTPADISTTVEGTVVYSDASNTLVVCDGTNWISLDPSSSGATSIDELSDGKYLGQSVYLGAGAGSAVTVTTNLLNTAVGQSSMGSNTTGYQNTAMGQGSLYMNTTGSNNTSIGNGSMANSTTGNSNTAVGQSSLSKNTTGYQNTAMGQAVMVENTTGYSNTAYGQLALYNNTAGFGNTAIGRDALNGNTEGTYNTALGSGAMYELNGTSASNNTSIGRNSGRGITTGSNNTVIGSNTTGLASDLSNTVILADGTGDIRFYSNSAGYTGIGTETPTADFEVAGTISTTALTVNGVAITGGGGSADKIVSNTTHITAYNDASISFITDDWERMTIAQSGRIGIDNTNPEYWFDVNGDIRATDGVKITNDSNIEFISSGSVRTYLSSGGISHNAGSYETFFFDRYLIGVDTDSPEASIHVSGTIIIADGGESCDSFREGGLKYNAATSTVQFCDGGGTWANLGVWSTNASDIYYNNGNVGIGTDSPSTTLHVFDVNDASETNDAGLIVGGKNNLNIVIDRNEILARSNGGASTLYFQNHNGNTYFGGSVGIKAATPGGLLHVNESGDASLSGSKGLVIGPVDGANLNMDGNEILARNNGAASDLYMQIEGGNIGIGTTTPGSYKLYVAGDAYSTGTWGSSDERLKKNVKTIDSALEKAMQLRGVTFDWRKDEFPERGLSSGHQIGFIAQEVEKVAPELVHTNDDGYKAVAYDKTVALLTEAIKELKEQNDALKARIEVLEGNQ